MMKTILALLLLPLLASAQVTGIKNTASGHELVINSDGSLNAMSTGTCNPQFLAIDPLSFTIIGGSTYLQGATLVGDTGTGGHAGWCPAPAAGDAAASKFLKADGTWATAGSSYSFTAPLVNTAGTITCNVASGSQAGCLSSTDWTTFNGKGSGTVTSVAASVPSIFSISGSPVTTSGTLAMTYSGTALPVANGGTGATNATPLFNYLSSNTSSYGGTFATLSFSGANNDVYGVGAGSGLTSGTDNTFIGHNACSSIAATNNVVCVGSGTIATAGKTNITVLGKGAQANDTGAITIGSGTTSSGANDITIGTNAGPQGAHTIMIGANSGGNFGTYGIQIGESAYVVTGKTGCIAIGHGVLCSNSNSISMAPGADATATANTSAANQFAIGDSRTSNYISEVCWGKGCVTTGTPQAVTEHPTDATGANIAGSNITVRPGNGTGTGGSGKVIFQAAPVATTSSSANTLATMLEINPDKTLTINPQAGGTTPTCTTNHLTWTSTGIECFCNGTNWVKTSDGSTVCTF